MPDPRGPFTPGRRPTMRDVAASAGVSLKTVSRVVNEEPGVSTVLTERVKGAIQELDFRPNAGASSLRRSDRRTSTVGLLVEDVRNPFSSTLQRAVEDVALPLGFMVFSASLDENPQRERELVRAFSERRADGLILVPSTADLAYLAKEIGSGMEIVCVDREASLLAVDSVVTTNASGTAEGVRHLAFAGHRRIGFLGDIRSIPTAAQRFAGYVSGLESSRLQFDPGIVAHDLRDSILADGAVTGMLSGPNPPTALFTAQNLITIGALRALRRLGLEKTVALLGFDDFTLADLMDPGVSVVAQDPATMGRVAADLLFDRIGGTARPPATHVVPTTLIRRGSGEIRPPQG
jgi:LacI family transcriptional regulator